MDNIFYIGFDFSINKPAATVLINNKYHFFAWPSSLTKATDAAYKSLVSDYVKIVNRDLDVINDKDESISTYKHTVRSYELAKIIIDDLYDFVWGTSDYIGLISPKVYMASEGLSFGSRGNVMLNLATYKGVFLSEFYKAFHSIFKEDKFFTYSPITIKSTAGCAGKDARNKKDPMIDAFLKEPENEFSKILKGDTLKSKNNKYYACVDDIVDSYWVLQTMLKKQNLL